MFRFRYFVFVVFTFLIACTKNKEQVKISIDSAPGQVIKQSILSFADTVNVQSRQSTKQQSLIYSLGDYSFHVCRYLKDSKVSLYVEHGHSSDGSESENRYYLEEGEVALRLENLFNPKGQLPFQTVRTFYRDGKLLFSEQKSANTRHELAAIPYRVNDGSEANVNEEMKKLNDAIYQRGRFDLKLEGIAEYPKAQYIILSQNGLNAYRAAVLIERKDDFIKAIIANPEKYSGRKLQLTWNLKDQNKAVYVKGRLAD